MSAMSHSPTFSSNSIDVRHADIYNDVEQFCVVANVHCRWVTNTTQVVTDFPIASSVAMRLTSHHQPALGDTSA
jgi:hypothetical protein